MESAPSNAHNRLKPRAKSLCHLPPLAMAAGQPPSIDPDKYYQVRIGSLIKPSAFVLRYDFKPQSVNVNKAGLLTRSSTDKVFVDWQNQSSDLPPISFTGKFETCKDVDCILTFDEIGDGSFILEPMAGMVKRLTHDRLGGQAAAHRLATLPDEIEPESQPNLDEVFRDSADEDVSKPVEEFDDLEGSDVSFDDD